MPRCVNAADSVPRFREGDRVRVQWRFPIGHIRTPFYLRGKTGTVVRSHGAFLDAEKLANGLPGLPATVVYQVAFAWEEVWPASADARGRTLILADLQDNWLDAAVEEVGRKGCQ